LCWLTASFVFLTAHFNQPIKIVQTLVEKNARSENLEEIDLESCGSVIVICPGSVNDEISRQVYLNPWDSLFNEENFLIFAFFYFREESKDGRRHHPALSGTENAIRHGEEGPELDSREGEQGRLGSQFRVRGLDFGNGIARTGRRNQSECGPVVMAPGTVGIARNCTMVFLWGVQVKPKPFSPPIIHCLFVCFYFIIKVEKISSNLFS